MRIKKIGEDQFEANTDNEDSNNLFGYSGKYFLGQRDDSLVFVTIEGKGPEHVTRDEVNELFRDALNYSYNALFVRIDEKNSSQTDFYSPLFIEIDPHPLGDEEIDHAENVSAGNLFIGKSKTDEFSIPSDSIVIETDEVFINLHDIPFWVSRQQDLVSEEERSKVVIRLNIDRSVSDRFKQKIIQTIRSVAPLAQILEARLDTNKQEICFVKAD